MERQDEARVGSRGDDLGSPVSDVDRDRCRVEPTEIVRHSQAHGERPVVRVSMRREIPGAVWPSPKSQSYDTIVPSESVEANAANWIGTPGLAVVRFDESAAIGGKSTVMSEDTAFEVWRLSVTVRTTEKRDRKSTRLNS